MADELTRLIAARGAPRMPGACGVIRPRVINKRRHRLPADGTQFVDITRQGAGGWGNPRVVGVHGTRAECIAWYRKWLPTQPALMARLPGLAGKTLGCVCAPLPCRGDVIADLVCETLGVPADA